MLLTRGQRVEGRGDFLGPTITRLITLDSVVQLVDTSRNFYQQRTIHCWICFGARIGSGASGGIKAFG